MTTPASPAPATPAAVPAPPPAGNFLDRALRAVESHLVPALKTAEASAERIISEAQKIEAVIEASDPAIGTQLASSAAVLREIAAALAAL